MTSSATASLGEPASSVFTKEEARQALSRTLSAGSSTPTQRIPPPCHSHLGTYGRTAAPEENTALSVAGQRVQARDQEHIRWVPSSLGDHPPITSAVTDGCKLLTLMAEPLPCVGWPTTAACLCRQAGAHPDGQWLHNVTVLVEVNFQQQDVWVVVAQLTELRSTGDRRSDSAQLPVTALAATQVA